MVIEDALKSIKILNYSTYLKNVQLQPVKFSINFPNDQDILDDYKILKIKYNFTS